MRDGPENVVELLHRQLAALDAVEQWTSACDQDRGLRMEPKRVSACDPAVVVEADGDALVDHVGRDTCHRLQLVNRQVAHGVAHSSPSSLGLLTIVPTSWAQS